MEKCRCTSGQSSSENHIYATWNNIMIPLYHTLLYINFISIMSRRVRTEKRYKYLQALSNQILANFRHYGLRPSSCEVMVYNCGHIIWHKFVNYNIGETSVITVKQSLILTFSSNWKVAEFRFRWRRIRVPESESILDL